MNTLNSESIQPLWKEDNIIDVELCNICYCLPCECRIVNIILPSPACVNSDEHEECDSQTEENTFKVEHLNTSETHDSEPSNCSFQKYSVHMKRSFIAKVKSSKENF